MAKKLKLDIPLVLPDIPDLQDACVDRLVNDLESTDGVEAAHIISGENGHQAQLCIHYDPEVVPLPHIRQIAHRLGAELTDEIGHVIWNVDGLHHARKARALGERLRNQAGVLEAEATASGVVRVEYERRTIHEQELKEVLRKSGSPVAERSNQQEALRDHDQQVAHSHKQGGIFGEKTEIVFAILAGIAVGLGWLLEVFTTVDSWIPITIFAIGYLFGGIYTLREAWESIRLGRFEIDFLMLFAAGGAAALGEWFEGGLLLFLFSLGHALEHYAMGRARKAIESLADLAPDTAIVRKDGEEDEVPVESLAVGDLVIVRTNERIPADGFVVKGMSTVNQAPVTGESIPVDKSPVADATVAPENWLSLDAEHRVFAGTINGSSPLEVVVAKLSSESTLARVVQMVTDAETQKSPTQRFADKFERVFVPMVLGLVFLLLFAWVVVDESFAASFYRAMAVLVAASPCALAIATPSAVLSGVARAGRGGVLIKGGGPLENLGNLGAIAFDKTGTLTEGKPRVTDAVAAEGVTNTELLRTAVAVERLSDHPLAAAVVRYGLDRLEGVQVESAVSLESITGRGLQAVINGEKVYIGKDDLFDEIEGPALPVGLRETIARLEEEGRTTMILQRGGRYLGVIGLMDTPRKTAAATIASLRALGIRKMIMISGDNQQVADAIAGQVGLDEAWGDLMPEDKVEMIKALSREENVAMVGDGVNDAPAMANATVGIAMGAAGSDVALETADVALMADDLSHLPFVLGLSRKTRRIIKQNLWISLGMVVFLVPATISGLSIGPAVVLHEGSTLVVVLNALRLLAYKDRPT